MQVKFGNFRLCISFSFFAVTALALISVDEQYVYITLLCCLLHELGHLVLMLALRANPQGFVFYGGGLKLIAQKKRILPFYHEMIILICGPLMNLLAFAVFFCLLPENPFCYVNLILCIFNMLPFRNFDGGGIIQLISGRFLDYNTAESFEKIISYITTILACILIFLYFYFRLGNFTVIATAVYIAVSEFFCDT